MTSMAQKNSYKSLILPLALFWIAVTFFFLLIPETFYFNPQYRIATTLGRLLPFAILAPILTVFSCFVLSVIFIRITPRVYSFIFLTMAILPVIAFLFLMATELTQVTKIGGIAIRAGSLLMLWFGLYIISYSLFARYMSHPWPPTLRWATGRRLVIGGAAATIIFLSYMTYPKVYFVYQQARGHAGNIEAQLWLGEKYIIPHKKRFLGEVTSYTKRDHFKSRDWYERAALQGDPKAYIELAKLYYGANEYNRMRIATDKAKTDWEKEIDVERAIYWIKRAENAGYKAEGQVIKVDENGRIIHYEWSTLH